MKEVIEKSLYATLGAWLYIHEKADEVIKDLVNKGKLAPEEGKTFLDEISKRADDEKEQLKERFSSGFKSFFEETGLASKEDIKNLRDLLAQLENRISSLEKKEESTK